MTIDPNTWTLKTQEAVNSAMADAKARSHAEVTPDHVLAALLTQDDGVVLPVVRKVGLAPMQLKGAIEDRLSKLPTAYGTETRIGREFTQLFEAADAARTEFGDDYLSTEHVLLAAADADRELAESDQLMAGVSRDDMLAALAEVRGSQRVTSQNPEDTYQALEKYGQDLTEDARSGKLDPVIGRDSEIR
ncbi:MAG: type VI secretion system ATPase TssH, partial [Microthrixaceae bacterium]|nr:type VI secretion system ATPase TssH [Microthrixaceae bacterium]